MTDTTARISLGFLLLAGFCARAATYKSPLLDHHGWRQADTASIARNFYRERFNPLYPQVDERGAGLDGSVETGFEVFAFGVAAIAKLTGFTPQIGRVANACLFLVSAALVWTFVKRRYGVEAGLAGTFLYAVGFPLQLYIERAFMNEALLVCLSLASLVAAQRYLVTRGALALGTLVVASSLVGAVKLPYLIIWAPLLGLFIEARGRRAARSWELWLMATVNLAVAAAWYSHAHRLAEATGLSFGLFDKLFDARVVFSWAFVSTIAARLFKDVLDPIGCLAALAGLWFAVRQRRWAEPLAVAGFLAYLVLVARGNAIHDYYQLAIVPMAPALAALGLVRMADHWRLAGDRRAIALATALGAAALSTFVRSASAHSWYEYSSADVELCRQVAALSRPADRIVVVGDNNPQWLFCTDRKGWLLAPGEADDSHVRAIRDAGARLAIIAPEVRGRADLMHFLSDAGTVLPAPSQMAVVRFN